ncbi:phosphoribosylamine--glycine ligase [Formosimonas limnophila]|uniref:Phosphoribosylamine--glycine ligase n=1 Tax=Formosimonas limnophila TaxID=1384487 RepID=A0A8J3CN90_9BURK|nr:phosphoribosylamine--glycine ligase [Formosimonas limnophila]GHA74643.1 phosphoribosylamine--glycine ligase [Formosimonas limnophila]
MNILIIGSGGREHALTWKMAQSAQISTVFVAPGNAGTAQMKKVQNITQVDNAALVKFAQDNQITLTVVGPEAPLSKGVVDAFRAAGLTIFGPTQAAAQLESSKSFAKAFMARHNIPTAAYADFTDAALAHDYVNTHGAPIVVKADGLAAGKGVVVAMTLAEAHEAIDDMLADNRLGDAGARVVIEEFLDGEEASFIVLCDGEHALPLATSQDHKRLLDGDAGPNTGGMGAYSPAPIVTPEVHERALREVIYPTLAGMKKDGITYTGFLYAGLMIKPDGSIKVLEFNCRMGDPETQPIMMRLNSDLFEVLRHGAHGTLNQVQLDWDNRVALGVVVAAHNYPATPRVGDVISTPENTLNCVIFHAGTTEQFGQVITSGGRVLCVTALGRTLKEAQQTAYTQMTNVQFDGMQYRKDIGYRAAELI